MGVNWQSTLDLICSSEGSSFTSAIRKCTAAPSCLILVRRKSRLFSCFGMLHTAIYDTSLEFKTLTSVFFWQDGGEWLDYSHCALFGLALVFPLLEFLSVKEIYNEKILLQRKLDLLGETNMVDFAVVICRNLYSDDIPHVLREKRTILIAQLKQLQAETEPIVKMFECPETTRQRQSTRVVGCCLTTGPISTVLGKNF